MPLSPADTTRLLQESKDILDREAHSLLQSVRAKLTAADPDHEHPEWHSRIDNILSNLDDLHRLL